MTTTGAARAHPGMHHNGTRHRTCDPAEPLRFRIQARSRRVTNPVAGQPMKQLRPPPKRAAVVWPGGASSSPGSVATRPVQTAPMSIPHPARAPVRAEPEPRAAGEERGMGDDRKVYPWPKVAGTATAGRPKPVRRPCDAALWSAVMALETQLGSIEAYNRLCEAAANLKAKIDAGNAEAQNPLYAIDPHGAGSIAHTPTPEPRRG